MTTRPRAPYVESLIKMLSYELLKILCLRSLPGKGISSHGGIPGQFYRMISHDKPWHSGVPLREPWMIMDAHRQLHRLHHMAATNFLGRLLPPRLAAPIGDFSSCHVRRLQSRDIDTHAIQKDRSGQEELSIYHHNHQYLICNFGNPKKNRDHNQQDLSGFGLPCS